MIGLFPGKFDNCSCNRFLYQWCFPMFIISFTRAIILYDIWYQRWIGFIFIIPPFLLSLRQVLLQSEEELLARRSPELFSEEVAPKSRKTLGKMKMQLEGTVISFLSRPFLLWFYWVRTSRLVLLVWYFWSFHSA